MAPKGIEKMDRYRADRHYAFLEGGMIAKDGHAIANMPQKVVMREYPKPGYGTSYIPGDDIGEIDRQMSKDDAGMRKHLQPEKY